MNRTMIILIGLGFLFSGCNSKYRAPGDQQSADGDSRGIWKEAEMSEDPFFPDRGDDGDVSGLVCPHPEPHYKVINSRCLPSCGVVLKGRPGEMHDRSCKTGFTYAGFSWEESLYRSKCCVKNGSTPTPTPNPTPGPTPNPPPSSCRPQPKPESEYTCRREQGQFWPAVDAALDEATRRHPEMLDLNDDIWQKAYMVLDTRFFDIVVQVLIERGYCAYYDGEELAVKNSEGFNEQFDIHLANGHLRRGTGSYRVDCFPAWF